MAVSRERRNEITREYYHRHKEAMRERNRLRYIENADQLNADRREKYASDPEFAQRDRDRNKTRRRTRCSRGHEFTEANTAWVGGRRRCNRCAAGMRTTVRTHCRKGHALEPSNVYINPNTGRRRCRACHDAHPSNVVRAKRISTYRGPTVEDQIRAREEYVLNVRQLRLKHWTPEGVKREVPLTDEELEGLA